MARYCYVGVRERDELAVPSQRLIEAALIGDMEAVNHCLKLETIDVNYIGTVRLKVKCIETVLREEEADEIEIEHREFVTDVTPLYAASHSGRADIARKLLSTGADVNQELFRGFATTAAAREGHCIILHMLLKAGASRSACEDALLEACLCGQSKAAKLLIRSEMTGRNVEQQALVSVSCRGFVEVARTLIENGVDINCRHRILLRSVRPALHANVDCTPLVAAIVSRQTSMVEYLLKAGARTNCLVRLGAWSWDVFSGEELRVGAGLGEPYNEVWCAVEYYEASGQILNLLLQHQSSFVENQQQGRTLLCHAVLCQNPDALGVLLNAGADFEFPVKTKRGQESRPIHLAARIGYLPVLQKLISHGCRIDARTENGDTALMLAAKADQTECFLELINSGADLGLINNNGENAIKLAKRSAFGSTLTNIFQRAIIAGKKIYSSNFEVFSLLHFVVCSGNTELLQMILENGKEDINSHDGLGLTPAMVAVKTGHTEAFRILIDAGADISAKNRDGQTVVSLLQNHPYTGLRTWFEEILLAAVLSHKVTGCSEFTPLHFAACVGNLTAIIKLLEMSFPLNVVDDGGYSPLMLAAKEGHADACKLLLQRGANYGIANYKGETALSLARKNHKCKAAEGVLFDYLARSHVLRGGELWKHIREGRGSPHLKVVSMLKSGILTWGKSRRRNVTCKEAVAGPSASFLKNRRKAIEDRNTTIFRVLSVTGREIHFEAGSPDNLELWVHGINLVMKEADSGFW